MRLLCYADVQAGEGDARCLTKPGVSLQHFRVEKFFKDIHRIYQEHKCNGVVDLGDTTDDRNAIPLPTLELVGQGVDSIPDGNNFKLTGNHEQFLRDTSISNRTMFEHRFAVVNDRNVWKMDGWLGFFCSFPANYDELTQWIIKESDRFPKQRKILFGHFQVVGAAYTGAKSITGVPQEALKNFDLVLLGHVHLPQAVAPHIHYVGSPFQQDWGEAGQAKRVAILDTEAPADKMLTWVPMTEYPEYFKVTLTEFQKAVEKPSEHRYNVVLKSHEEAEVFFRHPGINRAVAVYDYNADNSPTEAKEEGALDWTFDGICRRYLGLVPPSKVNITISTEEMLDLGRDISTSS